MKPDVTVLMPVYNGERYLRPAIDSILSQTHRNFELVIVDDGSSDGSAAIISSYTDPRIRAVTLPQNAGLSRALNEGLRIARAPLIARQDADDTAQPFRLERQLARMQEQPELALLGSQAIATAEDGHQTGVVHRPVGRASIRWFSLFDNPFVHTSVIFRTDIMRDAGGYNAAYDPFSQDYDLWCRVMAGHPTANLPDTLVRYRVSDSSIIGALQDDEPDYAYHRRFEAILEELTLRQARRLFGESAVADEDGVLLAGLVCGLSAERVPAFLSLFERLLGLFRETFGPDGGADFNETLARQFDALAFRVRPASRASVVAIYAHVLRHHPELAPYISWPKTVGMLIVGKAGRESLGRWWRQ